MAEGLSSRSHDWRRAQPLLEPCRSREEAWAISLLATLSFYPPVSHLYLPLVKPKDYRGQRSWVMLCRDGLPGQRAVQRRTENGGLVGREQWKLNSIGLRSSIPFRSTFSLKLHAAGAIKLMLHLEKGKQEPLRADCNVCARSPHVSEWSSSIYKKIPGEFRVKVLQ